MSETITSKQQLNRRLRPLYAAAFLQSFVLWYTIEKLFMRSIGFTDTGIGVMVAVYSVVMLIVETPSGLLADRWSRRGMLIVASFCLAGSGLIGGLSTGIGMYLSSAVLWGTFFACYSGMYDTIVYDCIAEAEAPSSLFDYFYGRIQSMDSLGLVLGGLLGGVVAQHYSLRATYFISLPVALAACLVLMKFDEPRLHKAHIVTISQQVRSTYQAILKHRSLAPVIIVLIIRSTLAYCIFEFGQLWLLALHTPTAFYGLANAVLLSSIGLGGILADRLRLSRYLPMLVTLLTTLTGGLGLILLRGTGQIVAAQFLFAAGLIAVDVIFSRLLHDALSSNVRAGAASAASTLGRFIIIPTALAIGYISQRFSIYHAAYILVGLAVIMSGFVLRVAARNSGKGLVSPTS